MFYDFSDRLEEKRNVPNTLGLLHMIPLKEGMSGGNHVWNSGGSCSAFCIVVVSIHCILLLV